MTPRPAPPEDFTFPALLGAARAGRREALGRLLDNCRPYLLTVARLQMGANPPRGLTPADLAQDTFVRALRGFPGFRGGSEADFLAWLRRILRNCLADHVSADRLRTQSPPPGLDPAADDDTPSGCAMADEESDALWRAVERLPSGQREVMVLYLREGLGYAAIGGRLGRSPDAVRMLYQRAYEAIGQRLRP